jgi:hypothetical protein
LKSFYGTIEKIMITQDCIDIEGTETLSRNITHSNRPDRVARLAAHWASWLSIFSAQLLHGKGQQQADSKIDSITDHKIWRTARNEMSKIFQKKGKCFIQRAFEEI